MRSTRIQVRSYHCDSYAHVNNARYLEFLEEARWDYLEPARKKGIFDDQKLIFLVVNVNIDYKFPAEVDDILDISTGDVEYGRSSLTIQQVVYNTTKDRVSARASIKFVLFSTVENKSVFISDDMKTLFNELDGKDQD